MDRESATRIGQCAQGKLSSLTWAECTAGQLPLSGHKRNGLLMAECVMDCAVLALAALSAQSPFFSSVLIRCHLWLLDGDLILTGLRPPVCLSRRCTSPCFLNVAPTPRPFPLRQTHQVWNGLLLKVAWPLSAMSRETVACLLVGTTSVLGALPPRFSCPFLLHAGFGSVGHHTIPILWIQPEPPLCGSPRVFFLPYPARLMH